MLVCKLFCVLLVEGKHIILFTNIFYPVLGLLVNKHEVNFSGQLVDHRPAISRLLTGYKPVYSRLITGL